ncbi:hypothetical protein FQN57_001534 [Myotisia sp. PD_48]|nr:hypothetical protein FQN57_001534 [Myotisia sp. PD_48]
MGYIEPELAPPSISVLFVCLGNICRSTMAEAVFRHYIATKNDETKLKFGQIDSAGTGAYHIHSPPDRRTIATLRHHNITDYSHSARKVSKADFTKFDYILGMDAENVSVLEEQLDVVVSELDRQAGDAESRPKLAQVSLFGDFEPDESLYKSPYSQGRQVADPYYGEDSGFEEIYHQLVRFSAAFMNYLTEEQGRNT